MPGATSRKSKAASPRFTSCTSAKMAEVFKRMEDGMDRRLAIIEEGSLIGEMSLFSQDGSHTATVRSITPLLLLQMPRSEFDALLHRLPGEGGDRVVRLEARHIAINGERLR